MLDKTSQVEDGKPVAVADSALALLRREADLLLSLPSHVSASMKEHAKEIWNDKTETALSVAGATVVGFGLQLAARRIPGLGQALPILYKSAIVADLLGTVGLPVLDTAIQSSHLEHDKQWLGENIGKAAIDLPLYALGSLVGAGSAEFYHRQNIYDQLRGPYNGMVNIVSSAPNKFLLDRAYARNPVHVSIGIRAGGNASVFDGGTKVIQTFASPEEN